MKSMSTITFLDGTLYMNSNGKSTPQETLYHMQNMVTAAKRHGAKHILIVSNATHSTQISVAQLTQIGNVLGKLPEHTRVAYVPTVSHSSPIVTARLTFIVGAAQVHGVSVHFFSSIEKAREWLGLTLTNVVQDDLDQSNQYTAPADAPGNAKHPLYPRTTRPARTR